MAQEDRLAVAELGVLEDDIIRVMSELSEGGFSDEHPECITIRVRFKDEVTQLRVHPSEVVQESLRAAFQLPPEDFLPYGEHFSISLGHYDIEDPTSTWSQLGINNGAVLSLVIGPDPVVDRAVWRNNIRHMERRVGTQWRRDLGKYKELESTLMMKTLMIGDSNVGKLELMMAFVGRPLPGGHPLVVSTIGIDFQITVTPFDDREGQVKLAVKHQVWDTASQERFRTITNAYYRGCNGIVLVFDVTVRESFDHIDWWIQEIERGTSEDHPFQWVLVGNRTAEEAGSRQRAVPYSEAKALAEQYGLEYIEVDIRSPEEATDPFAYLTAQWVETALARRANGAQTRDPANTTGGGSN